MTLLAVFNNIVIQLAKVRWVGALVILSLIAPLYAMAEGVAVVKVSGVVLDQKSLTPIEGALVLVSWEKNVFHYHASQGVCPVARSASTDRYGKFALSVPSGLARGTATVDIKIYKEGKVDGILGPYRNGRIVVIEPVSKSMSSTFHADMPEGDIQVSTTAYLEDSNLDPIDRMQYLEALKKPTAYGQCEDLDQSDSFKNFYSQIALESTALAKAVKDNYSPAQAETEKLNYLGLTPLMDAARLGNLQETQRLLSLGANPNRTKTPGNYQGAGFSALTFAIESYSRPCGAVTNRIRGDFIGVISALLHAPAIDPNKRAVPQGDTPLTMATALSQADVVDLLLSSGADPNAERWYGETPLYIAASGGCGPANDPTSPNGRILARLLHSPGIAIDKKAGMPLQAPLAIAKEQRNELAVQMLLAAGAK